MNRADRPQKLGLLMHNTERGGVEMCLDGVVMNESDVREIIADALEDASVTLFHDKGLRRSFLGGHQDVALAELDIDSLGVVELCIFIEEKTGVSITPSDVKAMSSLGELLSEIIAAMSGRNSSKASHLGAQIS